MIEGYLDVARLICERIRARLAEIELPVARDRTVAMTVTRMAAVATGARISGEPPALQRLKQDEVERIFAGAVRNAVRHSGAARIEWTYAHFSGRSVIEARDDGCGVSAPVDDAVRHFGIRGMRERAQTSAPVASSSGQRRKVLSSAWC